MRAIERVNSYFGNNMFIAQKI